MKHESPTRFMLERSRGELLVKTSYFPYDTKMKQKSLIHFIDFFLNFLKNALLNDQDCATPLIEGRYFFLIHDLLSMIRVSQHEAFKRIEIHKAAENEKPLVIRKEVQRAINHLPKEETDARKSMKAEEQDALVAIKKQLKTLALAQECSNTIAAYNRTYNKMKEYFFAFSINEILEREKISRINISNEVIGDPNNPNHFAFQIKLFNARTNRFKVTRPLFFNHNLRDYVDRCVNYLAINKEKIIDSIEKIRGCNANHPDEAFLIASIQPINLLLASVQKLTNTEGIELSAIFFNLYLNHAKTTLNNAAKKVKFHIREQESVIRSALSTLSFCITELKALSTNDCPVFGNKLKGTGFFNYINVLCDIHCFIQIAAEENRNIAWMDITKSFRNKCSQLINYLSNFVMQNTKMKRLILTETAFSEVQCYMANIEVDWYTLTSCLSAHREVNNSFFSKELVQNGKNLWHAASFMLTRDEATSTSTLTRNGTR